MYFEVDAEQNHNIRVANKSSENVTKLNYLGATLKYQNCSHKETYRRLNLEMLDPGLSTAFCLTHFVSEDINIEIYRTITWPVV